MAVHQVCFVHFPVNLTQKRSDASHMYGVRHCFTNQIKEHVRFD